jgi:hypothetical protein
MHLVARWKKIWERAPFFEYQAEFDAIFSIEKIMRRFESQSAGTVVVVLDEPKCEKTTMNIILFFL